MPSNTLHFGTSTLAEVSTGCLCEDATEETQYLPQDSNSEWHR